MKKWIYRILMIVCLVVFGFSAYQLWTIYSTQNTVKEETEELEKLVVSDQGFEPDWQALQAQNPDIIAWIVVPGCEISYPVVQGEDNSYYLDHTVNQEYNRLGSIFLDANAPSDLSQDNSIIYGHSVDIGGMFTNLSYFEDADFFTAHPTFYLLTPAANYECSIVFFAKDVDGSVYYTTSFGDYREERLSEMKEKSLYQNAVDTSEGNFLTLSTCDLDYGFDSNQRLILMGKLKKTEEPIKVD